MNTLFQFDEYTLNEDGTFTRLCLGVEECGTWEETEEGVKLMQEGYEDRIVKRSDTLANLVAQSYGERVMKDNLKKKKCDE